MIALEPPFRLAAPADGAVLAALVNYAGEGLPLHLWTALAAPGEDPWALGARRQAEKAAEGKVVVLEHEGRAVAALTGYAVGPEPEPLDALPPIIRPLQELENLAPATWYVNVLAALPEARGRGFGRALLGVAERIAAAAGLARMSIIVASGNAGARRLYDRVGYREAARRPVVRDGWSSDSDDWVLLLKDLG